MQFECVSVWIVLLSTSQCWSDAKEERREGEGEGLPGHTYAYDLVDGLNTKSRVVVIQFTERGQDLL